MKRIWIASFIGLLASTMTCSSVWAQATAQISGAVQDQSGAVLPGVEVTATQTETGVSRSTVTNETGHYVLPNLSLGAYKLEAVLPGFRSFLQTGIVVPVHSNPAIHIVLQVGQVSEQVEVQANAGLVETRSLAVGQVMETARIMELPLNGRNAQELVLLGGAAQQVSPAGGYSFGGTRLAIATAGSIGTGTDYTLDGIRHIDPYDSLALPLPFPDALAEFKTEIGGQSAQQARGSQVSAVTKSGTDAFHGDLFEFVRNDLFNATTYFAAVDPTTGEKKHSTLKRHQFGGTAGGPIVKNKLFFFGGYQGTTIRQDPADTQAFVPTPAMMAGDFTAITSPACGRAVTLRATDGVDGTPTGFANNRINPALFNPVAVNLTKRLPAAQNDCGLVTYGTPNKENDKQVIGRMDYQLNPKHSIMGRVLFTNLDRPVPYELTPDNVLTVSKGGRTERASSYAIGDNWLVGPLAVASVRLAANYNHGQPLRGPKVL